MLDLDFLVISVQSLLFDQHYLSLHLINLLLEDDTMFVHFRLCNCCCDFMLCFSEGGLDILQVLSGLIVILLDVLICRPHLMLVNGDGCPGLSDLTNFLR